MAEPEALAGRAVLVTGGTRGLGREMALALARAGADIAVTATQSGATLEDAAKQLSKDARGGRVLPVALDVTDPDACANGVHHALEVFGRLDALVNNAGLGMRQIAEDFTSKPTSFWETAPADWARIVDVNLNGAFNMARAAVPAMLERGWGRIINISTSGPTMIRRGYAPYGPSKAALEAASRIWAQDLDGTGVTVNLYLPGGAADTDLIPPAAPGHGARSGADGNLLPAAIMQRGIVWLCSPQSDGVTGQRFVARLWDDTRPPDDAARMARSGPSEPASP